MQLLSHHHPRHNHYHQLIWPHFPPFPRPLRSPSLQLREFKNISTIRTNAPKDLRLDIDVHAPGTWIGCKGYKSVLHTGETVFEKLWDDWTHPGEESEREAQIYMELRDLWGTVIPRMIVHGGWVFCHISYLISSRLGLQPFSSQYRGNNYLQSFSIQLWKQMLSLSSMSYINLSLPSRCEGRERSREIWQFGCERRL